MQFPCYYIAAGTDYAELNRFVPAPLFRKVFHAANTAKATICIGAAGFYKLFINGKDVTKGELAPYISNPQDMVYYDCYDISEWVCEGENVLAVLLGNGFQNNPGGEVWDFDKVAWRGAPKFALRLSLVSDNGSITELESDESFKVCDSPIIFDDYRSGEYYDARLEQDGIYLPGFDDSAFKNAIAADAPCGEKRLCQAEPVRFYKEIKPVSVMPHLHGWLYDFGENNTGVCKLSVHAAAGQKIILRYGEWIDNGVFSRENLGCPGQTEARKDLIQKSEYICKDGAQTHVPNFIYNGFRYVYVEGITEEQATKELLTYMCLSSQLEECGSFSCSDAVVNKLWEITGRSDRSCFIYFPNDCSHREKNGWTGDVTLSCERLLLNFKAEKSLTEWLRNVVCAQDTAGALPGIVPTGGWGFAWGNGPAWDHVLVEIPYRLYQYRGTLEAAQIAAPAILRYILYLNSRRDSDGLVAIGLGDWCSIGYKGLPEAPLIVTDSITSMEIFRKAAVLFQALGDEKGYALANEFYGSIRADIRKKLIDFNTMTAFGNCQTTQAMAIFYNVFDASEKDLAFQVLLQKIEEAENHMSVGVLGARVIFHVLSENGAADLALEMITRPDYPSYGNWVERGATTLWEMFYTEGWHIDSFNHHFWGDIGNWFVSVLAGIRINPNVTDATYFEIKPCFVNKIEYATAQHTTPHGSVSVSWKRTGEQKIALKTEKGAQLCGKIVLPKGYRFADGSSEKTVTSGEVEVICVSEQ